ncbi:MAG: glycosyltransferase [Deltaproteobacteria bacterium]|nr:glycosyltransferase [Deltaproteobacteria bacterium]
MNKIPFSLQAVKEMLQKRRRLTIVLVATNCLMKLADTLESFYHSAYCPYNLILIDNGSSDGTTEWLQQLEEFTEGFMRSESTQSICAIYNHILGQLNWIQNDDLVVFLQPGATFSKAWDEQILKVVDGHSCPLVISPYHEAQWQQLSIRSEDLTYIAVNGLATKTLEIIFSEEENLIKSLIEHIKKIKNKGGTLKEHLLTFSDAGLEKVIPVGNSLDVGQSTFVWPNAETIAWQMSVMKNLHIAVDARTFAFGGSISRGIGHYAVNLLKTINKLYPNFRFKLYVEPRAPIQQIRKHLPQEAFEFGFFSAKTRPDSDLYFVLDPMAILTNFDSPFRCIDHLPTSSIFYDLIPLVSAHYHYDQWPEDNKVAYRSRLEQVISSNTQILAISDCTRQDVIRYGGVDPNKIAVIMAGLNQPDKPRIYTPQEIADVLKKFNLRPPYFLTVGACDPHKNFEFVLRSARALYRTFADSDKILPPMLAVAGSIKDDPYKVTFQDVLKKEEVKEVVFTDFVSREELECLYAGAAGLLFPSEYEGFGFPVLEAMAKRCAVITSPRGSIPEVGGDCVIYVEPGRYEDLVEAMTALMFNETLRADLVERGYERSKFFTWDNVAHKTVEAWRHLLDHKQDYMQQ